MSSTNKTRLPKPGLRNIKTALSVFFCILLFESIGRPNPLFACSAAIICMRETVYHSCRMGTGMIIGTLFGGIVGFVFLLIKNYSILLCAEAIVVGLGILTAIYLCNLLNYEFNKGIAAIISSVVVLAIVVGTGRNSPFLYALGRTIDTFIGVMVALFVNKFIYPFKDDDSDTQEGAG